MPDYDAWRAALEASPLRPYLRPELVVEGSRGCWWGEKHHCTFCGLNGALMTFRSKSADQFWTELRTLVERHQILDVMTADNILDMAYFRTLLPRMAAADWDLRVHFETKSNLRPEQIAALGAAGMVTIQTGVESLNGRVLKLMDKGVDGATNVFVMRECESNHMTVFWNYIYGFPGETDDDYRSILEQMPALVHLQPPVTSLRIVMERYSPYFERPELGFPRRAPAAFYHNVYDLPTDELTDLAYYFDCDEAGIGDDVVKDLELALGRWQRGYPCSTLIVQEQDGDLVIDDDRVGWPRRLHRLRGWKSAAYRALRRRRSIEGLQNQLVLDGHLVESTHLVDLLQQLRAEGLVFVDDAYWIALATTTVPMKAPSAA